jgi:hypothetical protein
LRQVGGVGVLKLMTPRVTINQRGVQLHELPPSIAVLDITQADQQAGPSAGGFGHAEFP